MAPKSVSNLKLAISSWFTPISLRQSSKRPIQSLKVPIFATLPGIKALSIQHSAFSQFRFLAAQTASHGLSADCLLRFKLRGPFLYIRGQALFCVFALEEDLLIFALDGQCRLHGNLPAGLDCAFDASDGLCGFVGRAELARVFHDVFHESVALVNVVNDSEFE